MFESMTVKMNTGKDFTVSDKTNLAIAEALSAEGLNIRFSDGKFLYRGPYETQSRQVCLFLDIEDKEDEATL